MTRAGGKLFKRALGGLSAAGSEVPLPLNRGMDPTAVPPVPLGAEPGKATEKPVESMALERGEGQPTLTSGSDSSRGMAAALAPIFVGNNAFLISDGMPLADGNKQPHGNLPGPSRGLAPKLISQLQLSANAKPATTTGRSPDGSPSSEGHAMTGSNVSASAGDEPQSSLCTAHGGPIAADDLLVQFGDEIRGGRTSPGLENPAHLRQRTPGASVAGEAESVVAAENGSTVGRLAGATNLPFQAGFLPSVSEQSATASRLKSGAARITDQAPQVPMSEEPAKSRLNASPSETATSDAPPTGPAGVAPAIVPLGDTISNDPPGPQTTGLRNSTVPSKRTAGSVVARLLALSGQATQTVELIPAVGQQQRSVGSAPVAAPQAVGSPATLAEGPGPSADTQIRALPATSPDRDPVAIEVHMRTPTAGEQNVRTVSPTRAAGEGSQESASPQFREQAAEPADTQHVGRAAPEPEQDHTASHDARTRRADAEPATSSETPAVTPAGRIVPHTGPATPPVAEGTSERPDSSVPKAVQQPGALERESAPEAGKASSLHEIKFEVTGGERRVEVRVSERGGEVRMTVRTPDTPLANSLRENLPALSARLAEDSVRSDTWHPAASSSEARRTTSESSAGGGAQDANSEPRQRDRESQEGSDQRRPQPPQEATTQKQKGRNFAWLMSSLR